MSRLNVFLLVLSLLYPPPPAYALRVMNTERAGLEEELQRALSPAAVGLLEAPAGLEENPIPYRDLIQENLGRLVTVSLSRASPSAFPDTDQFVHCTKPVLLSGGAILEGIRVVPLWAVPPAVEVQDERSAELFAEVGLPLGAEGGVSVHLWGSQAARDRIPPDVAEALDVRIEQKGDAIVLVPLKETGFYLEHVPQEISLTIEQEGYAAWIHDFLWTHQATQYASWEDMLQQNEDQMPLPRYGALREIRLFKNVFQPQLNGAPTSAFFEILFPRGAWSERKLKQLGIQLAQRDSWRNIPIHVAGGFQVIRTHIILKGDGSLYIATPEEAIAQLPPVLTVVERLIAFLMVIEDERAPDFSDINKLESGALQRIVDRREFPAGEAEYLERYLAHVALVYRDFSSVETLLDRLRPGGEPHSPFRWAVVTHLYRRHHGSLNLKFSGFERIKINQRLAELLIGPDRDPVEAVRLAALQTFARLAPPTDDLGFLTLDLNVVRRLRETDRTQGGEPESLPLRTLAGGIAQQLERQRAEGQGPALQMRIGTSVRVRTDWVGSEPGVVEIRLADDKQQNYFDILMNILLADTPPGRISFEERISKGDPAKPLQFGDSNENPQERAVELMRTQLFNWSRPPHPEKHAQLSLYFLPVPWVEERLRSLFPDWPELEQGGQTSQRYHLGRLGHSAPLLVYVMRDPYGRWGFQTAPLPASQLLNASLTLFALASGIMRPPPGDEEPGTEVGVKGGLEEAAQTHWKENRLLERQP